MLLWDFEASHWSRALLVFFPTHLGVEGFVKYVWDLSNLGYSPYMTNLGDKSHIKIIRDVFHHASVVYRGPYLTKPSDKLHLIWFVDRVRLYSPYLTNADKPQNPPLVKGLSVLSNMGNIPTADVTFSDGVCQIWVGFVEYGLLYTTVA